MENGINPALRRQISEFQASQDTFFGLMPFRSLHLHGILCSQHTRAHPTAPQDAPGQDLAWPEADKAGGRGLLPAMTLACILLRLPI